MTRFTERQLEALEVGVRHYIESARQQQADRVCEAVREWNRGRQRGDLKALVIEALSE